jgi:anthranilate/para-aminobenzoate synthase component I
LALELDQDPKERAELVMIVDVERNDLGRVAEIGSVRLLRAPRVVTLPTVHHRVATVSSRLRPDITRTELLEVTLPSGSVTGAPKVRAMEVIARLEPHRRGLYTGAFGVLCHDGSLVLAMAIRTLTERGGQAHYFAGGGIVADSEPAREVEETQWKGVQIAALRGG